MTSIETDALEVSEQKLAKPLDAAMLKKSNLHQMRLAEEMFTRNHPGVQIDHDKHNEIMTDWGMSGYSEKWREIINDPGFNKHPRIRGDFDKVTLDDLDYFRLKGELPEE